MLRYYSRPVAKAYSVILKTVSIRRRDYFLSVFSEKNRYHCWHFKSICSTFRLQYGQFKDFEIKSSVSFKKSDGFYGLETENELLFTQSIQSVTVSFCLPVNPCFVNCGIKNVSKK